MPRLAAVLALLLVAGVARAEDTHQEGAYNGAKPGVRPGAASGKPQKPPPPNTLSWIGFEANDGNGTLWLQAASPMQVADQRVTGRTLVVSVTGISKLGKNTWRFVDMRFFENPLSRAVAKKKRGKIEVRISFKNARDARQASVRTATEADGLHYVYLSFPPGSGGSGNATQPSTDEPGPATSPGEK